MGNFILCTLIDITKRYTMAEETEGIMRFAEECTISLRGAILSMSA